jgi:hypothetical protein
MRPLLEDGKFNTAVTHSVEVGDRTIGISSKTEALQRLVTYSNAATFTKTAFGEKFQLRVCWVVALGRGRTSLRRNKQRRVRQDVSKCRSS